jgi:hypothetical protein
VSETDRISGKLNVLMEKYYYRIIVKSEIKIQKSEFINRLVY